MRPWGGLQRGAGPGTAGPRKDTRKGRDHGLAWEGCPHFVPGCGRVLDGSGRARGHCAGNKEPPGGSLCREEEPRCRPGSDPRGEAHVGLRLGALSTVTEQTVGAEETAASLLLQARTKLRAEDSGVQRVTPLARGHWLRKVPEIAAWPDSLPPLLSRTAPLCRGLSHWKTHRCQAEGPWGGGSQRAGTGRGVQPAPLRG